MSGLPIGIGLMFLPAEYGLVLAATIMLLETAHVVSPMVLAWTRRELRAIVSAEWVKHIVLPPLILLAAVTLPADKVLGLYFAWNIYHFGMQNFGVLSLYFPGGGCDRRVRRGLLCLAVTAVGTGVLPFLTANHQIAMLCMGVFSFNHWLVDIGLSSRVARWHWGFVATMLLIGAVWLILRQGPLAVRLVPQIAVIRAGVGMVHFIYSARIWRFSDPKVRATIGREIFCLEPARIGQHTNGTKGR